MTRAERRRPWAAPVGTVLCSLLLAACSGASGSTSGPTSAPATSAPAPSTPGDSTTAPATQPDPDPSSAPEVATYVALGDSFSAAPYVPLTDLAGGCLRSSGNYPALLAADLGATLTDVTCSGADTADITGKQVVGMGAGTVPAQVRAVRRGTDLVTLGIGGNDANVFSALVSTCTRLAGRPEAPCAARLTQQYGTPRAVVAATGRRVEAALRRVRAAAPDALVVLVGYPRLVDPSGSCEAFPVAAGDLPVVAGLERALDRALSRAAAAAGATFLDLRPASRGHEICSEDPWVNGRMTDTQRALAFHPFAVEQQAVAARVARLVEAQ